MSHPPRVVMGTTTTSERDVDDLARAARRRRDAGAEVIWVGGGVTAEALAAIVVAEDAHEVLVGPPDDLESLQSVLAGHGLGDVVVGTASTAS